jgi:hypothetical protein
MHYITVLNDLCPVLLHPTCFRKQSFQAPRFRRQHFALEIRLDVFAERYVLRVSQVGVGLLLALQLPLRREHDLAGLIAQGPLDRDRVVAEFGVPKQIDLDVTLAVFASVRRGRKTVPLGAATDLAQMAGLAWGSIATVHSAGDKMHRIVGPASWQTDKWALPVFSTDAEELAGCETWAARLRRCLGLEPASVYFAPALNR